MTIQGISDSVTTTGQGDRDQPVIKSNKSHNPISPVQKLVLDKPQRRSMQCSVNLTCYAFLSILHQFQSTLEVQVTNNITLWTEIGQWPHLTGHFAAGVKSFRSVSRDLRRKSTLACGRRAKKCAEEGGEDELTKGGMLGGRPRKKGWETAKACWAQNSQIIPPTIPSTILLPHDYHLPIRMLRCSGA